MKVSIITPSFNSERTIRDTLRSINLQTYGDIESLVIDGSSKDGTVDIVTNEFSARSVVFSEPDKGIYDAMNKGISRCSGEIIGVLNSDDYYADETVISAVVEIFQQTDVEGVYGDLLYVDGTNTDKVIRKWVSGAYVPGSFRYGWMPPHPTFFVRRETYAKWGNFDLRFKSAADYELMLRFIHKNGMKLGYLRQNLVKMRVGGVSNASWKNRLAANKEDMMAWKVNGLKPMALTRLLKPLRKLDQFLRK